MQLTGQISAALYLLLMNKYLHTKKISGYYLSLKRKLCQNEPVLNRRILYHCMSQTKIKRINGYTICDYPNKHIANAIGKGF